jgi:hypothetical protein
VLQLELLGPAATVEVATKNNNKILVFSAAEHDYFNQRLFLKNVCQSKIHISSKNYMHFQLI